MKRYPGPPDTKDQISHLKPQRVDQFFRAQGQGDPLLSTMNASRSLLLCEPQSPLLNYEDNNGDGSDVVLVSQYTAAREELAAAWHRCSPNLTYEQADASFNGWREL
jgi:hypothetical protein